MHKFLWAGVGVAIAVASYPLAMLLWAAQVPWTT